MDTQTITQSFSLVDAIPGLKKAGAYHVGPCPFCGGRDRFTIKHTPTGDRWHCRNCGDGKYHDAIDYIKRRYRVDFKTALQMMGGQVQVVTPGLKLQPAPVKIELPSLEWQDEARREINEASERLEVAGNPGQEYLQSRGLYCGSWSGVWSAWKLGYGMAYGRPAIFIPWLDTGCLMGVGYRFIDGKEPKYLSREGSKRLLFGLQHIDSKQGTLMICEGEMNCISCFQVQPDGVNIVSIGGENPSHASLVLLRSLARKFDRVVIWADRRAYELQSRIGVMAKLIKSPVTPAVKWDASEMLANGLLADFLSGMLKVKCRGRLPTSDFPRKSVPI